MRAVYEATADINRGTIPPIEVEGIRGGRTAGNIHNGIDPAYLVEVNLFRGNAMDAALCLRQQPKGGQAEAVSSLGHVGPHKQAANLRQAATVLVLCMFMGMVLGFMGMVLGFMLVGMGVRVIVPVFLLDGPGNGGAFMQPPVDYDIDLG